MTLSKSRLSKCGTSVFPVCPILSDRRYAPEEIPSFSSLRHVRAKRGFPSGAMREWRLLDRRSKANDWMLTSVAAHPGLAQTDLVANGPAVGGNPLMTSMIRLIVNLLGHSAAAGALPILMAATKPDIQGGQYFGPRGLMELSRSRFETPQTGHFISSLHKPKVVPATNQRPALVGGPWQMSPSRATDAPWRPRFDDNWKSSIFQVGSDCACSPAHSTSRIRLP